MIKKTSRWLLILILSLSVLIALAVIGTRIALPKLTQFDAYISNYLSDYLNADISIENIEASWFSTNPTFTINNVKISDRQFSARQISINSIYGNLDVGESIKNFAPIFEQLRIDGLNVSAEQEQQRWLTVFSPTEEVKTAATNNKVQNRQTDNKALNRLLSILAKQSQVSFSNTSLKLKPQNLPSRTIGPMQLLMDNSASMHQLSGSAQLKNYGDKSTVSFAVQAARLSDVIIETPYQLYAKFENLTEQFFAFNLINTGVDIEQLALNSEVWATLKNGEVSDVTGTLAIGSLKFQDSKLPQLKSSSLRFNAIRENEKQHFLLSDIKLSDGENQLKIPRASTTYNFAEGYIERVALATLDFGDLNNTFLDKSLKGGKLNEALATLNVKGVMNNVLLSWKDNQLSEFSLQADLNDISVDSYKGAPALSGVFGLLNMSAIKGSVDLKSDKFSMHFPGLFDDRWFYQKAQGKVSWSIEKEQSKIKQINVNSELLSLQGSAAQKVNGRFSLVLPMNKIKPSELILMIGGQKLELKSALSYIPNKVVPESLKDWIKQVSVKGRVEQGAVVIRTPLKKIQDGSLNPSVQLDFIINKAEVKFSPDWPNYLADDLRVTIDNGDIASISKNGSLAKNQVAMLKVTKASSEAGVSVSGGISGDFKKFLAVIKTKKAYQQLSKPLQALSISGKHSSIINLTIPVPTTEKKSGNKTQLDSALRFNISSDVKNGKLLDSENNLTLDKINGHLEYDNVKGLKAKRLKTHLLNNPASVSITSEPFAKETKTSINLTGEIAVKSLSNWVDENSLKLLSGKSKYSARLDLCVKTGSCNQLVINSNLTGVAIDLPAPWGKTKKQEAKLQVVQSADKNKQSIWRYNYKDIVRGISQLTPTEKVEPNSNDAGALDEKTSDGKPSLVGRAATHIVLGGNRPEITKVEGVRVSGVLSGIDIDKLIGEFTASKSSAKKSSGGSAAILEGVNNIDLKLKKVRLLGQYLPSGWVNIQTSAKNWFAQFDLGLAAGQVNYSPKKGALTEVRLNHLVFNTAKDGKKAQAKSPSFSASATGQWPEVALSIDKLVLNDLNIGRWSARLAPTKTGYRASSIQGKIAQTTVSGELAWANQQANVKTVIDVVAKGGDFGAVLKQFGQERVLENKSGVLSAHLSWPGNPWSFEQGALNGSLEFAIKNGRIIEAGTSASFLRIFGILNLNTVIKRLKLDFSDLLESGVAFDKVTAKYQLTNGLATSEAPLKLEGDAANIEMKGTINLKDGTLAKRMQVAIPLTSNAPIAALLLATPQAAGIAFVIDKLLGKRLAKLTALSYDISGSWLEPKIKPVVRKAPKK